MTPSPYGALSDELEGLIGKLAKATGPDSRLDSDIVETLFPTVFTVETDAVWVRVRAFREFDGMGMTTSTSKTDAVSDPEAYLTALKADYRFHTSAKVTASVDAALALVERMQPGRRVSMLINDDTMPLVTIAATWVGQASTLPLAIILAALRSLQTGDAE